MSDSISPDSFSCPLPIMDYKTIQLAHGSGGKLSFNLIENVFLPCFGNAFLEKMEDQASLPPLEGRPAFSTDSFVVNPIFFPGGDIGELAVNGTVNDLCMNGAKPLYLSVGFILEEGLSIEDLHKITLSMRRAADRAGVQIVTGDTKVVHKGSCDRIFINTSGIGVIGDHLDMGTHRIRPGDKIILSGTMADHGMAVMTSREGLSFYSKIKSDTAALNSLVALMISGPMADAVKAMRDPTRGGVGTTLNEFARAARVGIHIYEDRLPVRDDVRGACEILGIDPIYVANEGKLIAIVAADRAESVLKKMHGHTLGEEAICIGEVTAENEGLVVLRNQLGIDRIIDLPAGEQLPRIC